MKYFNRSVSVKIAFKKVYKSSFYVILTEVIAALILLLYYYILRKTTTLSLFWQSNIPIYNWLQIIFSVINAILLGVTISMFIYILRTKAKSEKSTIIHSFSSLIFSAAATGCTVCGAFLLPLFGIAASLTALPFAGLEIKLISIAILIYAIAEYSRVITGVYKPPVEKIIKYANGRVEFNVNRKTLPQLKHIGILIIFVLFVYALPHVPKAWRISMQKSIGKTVTPSQSAKASNTSTSAIFAQINPPQGYETTITFGDIGPKMLDLGVIDFEKFKQIYTRSGQSLTSDQIKILTKGSNSRIKITPENSYFLLNFFWAFGLANQTKILTEGDMVKYGKDQTGSFASTGGWSLAKGDAMQYYSKRAIVPLTSQQEGLVNSVASNVYRPCCGNPTSFPDCNHGMALLGIFELMASQGATEQQMYEAGKYFNAFWFPSNAFDLALYFKNAEGKDFKDIDPKLLLSKDYSSAFGAQRVKSYLVDKGIQEKPPARGGGCGV